jgi:hypothetical protein
MNRLFRRHGIERINVWAMGRVQSTEDRRKSVWKIMNLTLDNSSLGQMPTAGYLKHLAATEQQQYLKLCSARWVEHFYLVFIGATIAAGTSEIQKNITALRGLGMPRAK